MKRLIMTCAALLLTALLLSGGVSAEYDPDVNYMELMVTAALAGDADAGRQAQLRRDEKIDSAGLGYGSIDFDDMFLLAKIIEAEAGSDWLSDEWRMCVGEVVLNRVSSPEFPDTIEEVLFQRGQYYSRDSAFFSTLLPTERSVNAALRLLEGERVLGEESVVFQSNFILGSGIYLQLEDEKLGSTYLCYSYYPEIYEE